MEKPPVIVYGSSGYTGKQICWKLAERKIPFLAAGRSQVRLEEQVKRALGGLDASYQCHAVDHTVEALTKLFEGARVVYNVTGPFMQIGHPVVEAALRAGCHYLDTTGEQDWMFMLKDQFGPAFERAGQLLSPACSWMWVGGLLAAEIALEQPGIDSLEIIYFADSNTSIASTKSFLRMCTNPQYFLENNELVMWPYATSYDMAVPGHHRIYKALPWGGGGEPVWYRDDPRVRNCTVLTGFKSQVMFGAVLDILNEFEKKYRHLPVAEQAKVTNDLGGTIVSAEPERENPDRNRSIVSCHARGNMNSTTTILRGNSPYIQTAVLAAEACERILSGKLKARGFASPAQAFGARALIAALSEQNLHCAQSTSV